MIEQLVKVQNEQNATRANTILSVNIATETQKIFSKLQNLSVLNTDYS